jgi:hypothetical protein
MPGPGPPNGRVGPVNVALFPKDFEALRGDSSAKLTTIVLSRSIGSGGLCCSSEAKPEYRTEKGNEYRHGIDLSLWR